MPASEAALTGAFGANTIGSVRLTPVAPSANEPSLIASGSTLNLNAVRSPGVQPASTLPPAGAQSLMPCLSTTSSDTTSLQSRFVGSGPFGFSTIAGPRASKPPIAGLFWSPDGFQYVL